MSKKTCSTNSKSKLVTLVLLLSLPLFITACTLADIPVVGKYFGGGGGGGSTSSTLTVWGLWENQDVANTIITRFNEQYPNVTVNYEDRSVIKPLVDYKERVYRRALDETGPDVMRVHISWLPSLRNSLVPMPEGMMSAADFETKFYGVATDNLVADGKIYGMPVYFDGLVLVYNKDHFEEIGQLEPPKAWEEFRRLAVALRKTDKGELVRGGAAMGTAENIDFFSDIIGLLMSQTGLVGSNFPNGIDSKAGADALSFYTNFVKEDNVWSDRFPEAASAFTQEKVSMIFVPVWNLLDIISARPDMNIGVAPVPQALPDAPVTWGSFWVDVVPQASKNAKAAWEYIAFTTSSEQQLFAFSESSKYRVYGAPYSLLSLSAELADNPYLNPLLQGAPYAKTNILAGRAGNQRQVDSMKGAVNDVLAGRSPQAALKMVKEELLK